MRLLVAVALSLFGFASVAEAQASSVVGRQFDAIVGRLAKNGYRESHSRLTGTLRQGQQTTFTVDLQQGGRYLLSGVCDRDCSDLDLALYDDSGNLLDDDTENDDVPIVTVVPRWTGRFRVTVKMHACSTNPCAFGLAVFRN